QETKILRCDRRQRCCFCVWNLSWPSRAHGRASGIHDVQERSCSTAGPNTNTPHFAEGGPTSNEHGRRGGRHTTSYRSGQRHNPNYIFRRFHPATATAITRSRTHEDIRITCPARPNSPCTDQPTELHSHCVALPSKLGADGR